MLMWAEITTISKLDSPESPERYIAHFLFPPTCTASNRGLQGHRRNKRAISRKKARLSKYHLKTEALNHHFLKDLPGELRAPP
jgi:hypothetical protein